MSTTNNNPQDELLLLRQANTELTEKSRTRKAKIAELESNVADLQGKLAAAETELQDLKIGMPLRQLAASVSPVPELWMVEFQKHFKLELRDGKLAVLNSKNEPVLDGKMPVEFAPASIAKLVTDDSNEDLTVFRHITAGSLASGGGANNDRASSFPTMNSNKPKTEANAPSRFGLR